MEEYWRVLVKEGARGGVTAEELFEYDVIKYEKQ